MSTAFKISGLKTARSSDQWLTLEWQVFQEQNDILKCKINFGPVLATWPGHRTFDWRYSCSNWTGLLNFCVLMLWY